MIMSGKIIFMILALFWCTENSHGKLIWEGSTKSYKGFRSLTSAKKHAYGQAFDDNPYSFKFPDGVMKHFSFHFFFAIAPQLKHKGSHGMAFVISPTRGIPGASADQYLGIFNQTNNGNSSNHVIAIELDTNKDDDFGDINDNHVGININGMRSIVSAPAGYYDQECHFKNISLIRGNLLRVTILYSPLDKHLNVTLSSPKEAYYPKQPLLSLNHDLSPYLLENMYVGFTASTGSAGALHYMLMWYKNTSVFVPDPDFTISMFPPYPKAKSKVLTIVLLTLALFCFLVSLASNLYVYWILSSMS